MKELNPKQGSDLEFSRFAPVRELPKGGGWFVLEPKPDERRRLAERLDLQELAEFTVKAQLVSLPGGHLWRLEGEIRAKFTQTCVISLGPAPGELICEFSELFSDREPRPHEDDPPEPLEDGGIDIGEVATQHLSLNLPDFPKAPSIRLDDVLAPRYRATEE